MDKGSGSGIFPDPDPGDPKRPNPNPQHCNKLNPFQPQGFIFDITQKVLVLGR